MKINHVMSNNVRSGIFESILNYFVKYASNDVEHIITEKPIDNSDVYHYHRPNLEKSFLKNSVTTIHHDLYDTDPWLDINNFTPRYREAHTVVCLNTKQQKELKELSIKNTIVIPHGYNENIFKSTEKTIQDKICIGIFSKRYGRKVKGEAYFYNLLKRISPEQFSFILVGEGRYQDYELLQEYGFESKFYERLPYVMFNELYSKIHILMVLSLFEGGPANIPEAIATGTPILTTPVGMCVDMVKDGINGFFIGNDIDYDISILNKIYQDNQFYQNVLRANTISFKENILTWEQVVKQYEKVYKDIIKE